MCLCVCVRAYAIERDFLGKIFNGVLIKLCNTHYIHRKALQQCQSDAFFLPLIAPTLLGRGLI